MNCWNRYSVRPCAGHQLGLELQIDASLAERERCLAETLANMRGREEAARRTTVGVTARVDAA